MVFFSIAVWKDPVDSKRVPSGWGHWNDHLLDPLLRLSQSKHSSGVWSHSLHLLRFIFSILQHIRMGCYHCWLESSSCKGHPSPRGHDASTWSNVVCHRDCLPYPSPLHQYRTSGTGHESILDTRYQCAHCFLVVCWCNRGVYSQSRSLCVSQDACTRGRDVSVSRFSKLKLESDRHNTD